MKTPLSIVLLPQVTWISDAEFRRMQEAYSLSFAAAYADWGEPPPLVSLASRLVDIPDSAIPMVYSPTIPNPDDLAWHTVTDGRPSALVLADEYETLASIQRAGSHEGVEMGADLFCETFLPLPNGGEIPQEIADPVEGDVIPVDLGSGDPVQTSSYVKPAWFGLRNKRPVMIGLEGEFDALGVCKNPFEIRPGGYAMILDANGTVRQDGPGPAAYKAHPAFRYGRRLAMAHARALRIRIGR